MAKTKQFYLLEQISIACYEENDGFVILANNEEEARQIANNEAADEGKIWDNPMKTKCNLLDRNAEPGIILQSFNAAIFTRSIR